MAMFCDKINRVQIGVEPPPIRPYNENVKKRGKNAFLSCSGLIYKFMSTEIEKLLGNSDGTQKSE